MNKSQSSGTLPDTSASHDEQSLLVGLGILNNESSFTFGSLRSLCAHDLYLIDRSCTIALRTIHTLCSHGGPRQCSADTLTRQCAQTTKTGDTEAEEHANSRVCSAQQLQGSKNLFSITRQGGSKRKVLVAKVAVWLKFQSPNRQMQRNALLVCF